VSAVRWQMFTDQELAALYEAIVIDDGIPYQPQTTDPIFRTFHDLCDAIAARDLKPQVRELVGGHQPWLPGLGH
jgi:hypothetical protein